MQVYHSSLRSLLPYFWWCGSIVAWWWSSIFILFWISSHSSLLRGWFIWCGLSLRLLPRRTSTIFPHTMWWVINAMPTYLPIFVLAALYSHAAYIFSLSKTRAHKDYSLPLMHRVRSLVLIVYYLVSQRRSGQVQERTLTQTRVGHMVGSMVVNYRSSKPPASIDGWSW